MKTAMSVPTAMNKAPIYNHIDGARGTPNSRISPVTRDALELFMSNATQTPSNEKN